MLINSSSELINNKNRNSVCNQKALYKLKKNPEQLIFLQFFLCLGWLLLLLFVCFFATGSSTYIVTFVSLYHGYCITCDNRSHWHSHRTNGKIPTDFGGLGFHIVCTIATPQQEQHYTRTLCGVPYHRGTRNQMKDFLACYPGQTQFEWVCPSMDFSIGTLHVTQLSISLLLNPAMKKYLRSTNSGVWDIISWLQHCNE